ncbi:hypothetical protein CANARDRAFT_28289 [[Candida] arabinofermentans NRRL YB-2248]|uniref:NEDD8-conjugating enzyme UBC12 n=1 Tax=[Candida] arabinofermentans NRRL YB-2248 TaxID=983967 RepID=A0A1E4T169_9ASCO|nr:hypothetical protein CANARDRAFT_28289 [[Candida] arabinofermentans NRRL YB-2248]
MQKERSANKSSSTPTLSVAFLRAKKDLQDYEEIPGITIEYQSSNPMQINLKVKPSEGYYKNGIFKFKCEIPEDYPNRAPEFKCIPKIYHPNIDLEGHVCLNILRNDWKPSLSLQLVFAGILHLFLQPNPNDPLNKDAANDLAKYPLDFKKNVERAMMGGYVKDEQFDKVLEGNFNTAHTRYYY